jgi:glycosyltransferase involved in cell wall biosynthesis
MLLRKIKQLVKQLLRFSLSVLTRHPRLRRFCASFLEMIGLYRFMNRLRLRVQTEAQPNDPESEVIALNDHEASTYQLLQHFLSGGAIASSPKNNEKKRLAFVSPLPPLRSGISDYSAQLLPLLADTYQIDVIVEQDEVSNSWINTHCCVKNVDWFVHHHADYDRVIYHFGNSPFHVYMIDLIEKVPGIVVLHDFYISHLINKRYEHGGFLESLYDSHGYHSILDHDFNLDREQTIWNYPINLSILQKALQVIVHSEYSQQLAKQFYGDQVANDWSVIPLLRQTPDSLSKADARTRLNIDSDDFLVCCFGLTGAIKLNHRIVNAWVQSDLFAKPNCKLFFVGDNDANQYGKDLLELIGNLDKHQQITITGWTDESDFQRYLTAADVGIQLRAQSRGETSAAVLDCLNYGLATIVNANGSMAYLPDNVVHFIDNQFDDVDLAQALNKLWQDEAYRQTLSTNGQTLVQEQHAPGACAAQYVSTIESSYQGLQAQAPALLHSLINYDVINKSDNGLRTLAKIFTKSIPATCYQKQFLVDITAIATHDLRTGIQRVVRAQLAVLLQNPPEGYRVEPVYLAHRGGQWNYHYARDWTKSFLNIEFDSKDTAVSFNQGDILFCADLISGLVARPDVQYYYQTLKRDGIKVYFQVYDLLPMTRPEWFPQGAQDNHTGWCHAVAQSNGAFCISKAVADDLSQWIATTADVSEQPEIISHFHLGADIDTSAPTTGLPDNAAVTLNQIQASTSFLMVGTIEPRKGHAQTLAAFEQLWQLGVDASLVIVGKAGWLVDKFIKQLQQHKELNKRLFWLESISDEYLEKVYASCACLIAASENEGFGLPLIEAAQHKMPIIARKTPVFKEVAQSYVYYFDGMQAEALADAIQDWLKLLENDDIPKSDSMPWLTWQQSTEQLIDKMGLRLTNKNSDS